jgi:conjugal transfer mating pair stabilization protein TraN
MRIFNIISILTLITISASNAVFASGVGAAFNQREKFKNVTILGNPDEAKTFIKKDGDVSNIGSLNDASLTSRGNNALRSSELGEFLQHTELKKMDAINQHKINPDNSLLKESLKIEQNPMAKTGGGSLSASETSTTSFINKSCLEGVDFNVDVGLELVLDAEEKEEIIRKPQTSINLPAKAVPTGFWDKMYENFYTSDHELMLGLKYKLSNSSEAHSFIKRLISQSLGNVPADSIVLPSQNIIIFLTGSYNIIRSKGRNSPFENPAIKYRTSADELAALIYNQVLAIFHYSIEEKRTKFIEKGEYWQVATAPAEKLVEENECYETSRVCTRKGIKKFFGKYDINRPCWSEKISYECTSKPKDGCAHLTKENCRLVDSECEHRIGSICLRWKRNFTCPITKKEMNYSLSDSSIYCLGGNCHTPTIEENQDFSNVAYLAAINEAQKDCDKESSGICKNPITVFAGEANGCDKAIVGFINCCSANKGWGKDIKLSSCSPEEKGLALKRDKGLCHKIGTYCETRDSITKTCLVKRTNFCCFNSKLARIFHEQGRSQLNIDWGSSEFPNCRPLTLEELTKLDYSKFDMEELFGAMLAKGKSNMFKTFPSINLKTLPKLQQEHMNTTPAEKRDILKRKAEEEERARRAKEEEKRLAEDARLKAQQEKARLAEEVRVREERKKFLEKERIRKQQEQLRIAEENRIKREQALALHKQNELARLRQEKQAWYNNYIANMNAARNPTHVTQRLWYQFFGITPQEYINNPNYTANTAISRYGVDIVPPYHFIPRPFQ